MSVHITRKGLVRYSRHHGTAVCGRHARRHSIWRCRHCSSRVWNALLAELSQAYVVVLGIYYKLQTFLYLPASGIIQGMRPVIGYNYGAWVSGNASAVFFR